MALTHLLDTSFLISPSRLDAEPARGLATSVICIGELQGAVGLAGTAPLHAQRLAQLSAALGSLVALGVDLRVATAYGELRAATARGPANDLWIAATAKAHDLVLVTRDRGMARLPGVTAELVGA